MEENIRVNDDEMASVKPSDLAIQSPARDIGVILESSFRQLICSSHPSHLKA